jgi:hypothetical protein
MKIHFSGYSDDCIEINSNLYADETNAYNGPCWIKLIGPLCDGLMVYAHYAPEHIECALEALREKAERDKGCEHCDDDCCPRLNWHYGLDHILPGYKYCPMCGRKLQEAHK